MKKLLRVVLVACMSFSLMGCGSKREALSDSDVKKNFEKVDYEVSNLSTGDSPATGFVNKDDKTAVIYSEETGLCFMIDQSVYSVEEGTMITGDEEVATMKKKYNDLLKKVDVLEKELKSALKSENKEYAKKLKETEEAEKNKVYGVGERVVVAKDGIEYLALTINSVKTTTERNQFSDANPSQVIVINYSYENLAMDGDLYISSYSFTVVDGDGNVAETYPAGTNIYPQKCPVGAKSEGEEAYGIKSSAKTIKLRFSEYLPDGSGKVFKNFEIAF